MNEKQKFMLYASACFVLLIMAVLLPLAFRTAPAPDASEPEAAQTRVFLEFWSGEDSHVASKVIDDADEQLRNRCLDRFREISSAYLPDRELSFSAPDGLEITELRSGSEQFRICRIWVNARGDWQNWIDACFDADTGRIFYFYSDAACLAHPGSYGTISVPTDTAAAAETLADLNGDSIQYFFSVDSETAHGIFALSDGSISYAFSLNYRPGTLLQVSLVCE